MEHITVRAWPDPVVDTLGHDPRSRYVETFWLPTLGPTAVLLLRRVADLLDAQPDGFRMPVALASRSLGLGERAGSSSPLLRSLARLVQFGFACEHEGDHWVRRNLPPVSPKHVRRLPCELQTEHARWVDGGDAPSASERERARARRLAFVLIGAGEERDTAERGLTRIGFEPAVAASALGWASEAHRRALAAVDSSNAA